MAEPLPADEETLLRVIAQPWPEATNVRRLFATLDAERAAHAKTRRAATDAAERLAAVEAVARELLDAVEDAPWAAHYAHWDPTGGSGAGCPACHRHYEWRARARVARDRARAVLGGMTDGD